MSDVESIKAPVGVSSNEHSTSLSVPFIKRIMVSEIADSDGEKNETMV